MLGHVFGVVGRIKRGWTVRPLDDAQVSAIGRAGKIIGAIAIVGVAGDRCGRFMPYP